MGNESDRQKLETLDARIRKAMDKADPARKQKVWSPNRPAARMVRIGSDFIATVMVPMFAGGLLDRELGTQPLFMLVLLLVGFVVGLFRVVRALGAAPPAKERGSDGELKE